MHQNIVILAGGVSSRMKKAQPASAQLDPVLRRDAEEKSKSMIGVGGEHRPFLDYLLHNIAVAGYRHVVILIGEKDDSIRTYYENGRGAAQFANLKITYVRQPIPAGRTRPLGTADALWHALKATPEWLRAFLSNPHFVHASKYRHSRRRRFFANEKGTAGFGAT